MKASEKSKGIVLVFSTGQTEALLSLLDTLPVRKRRKMKPARREVEKALARVS